MIRRAIISTQETVWSSVAMATDQTSAAVDLRGTVGFSADFAWDTGSSLDGALIMQGSNNGTRYFDITNWNVTGATGSAAVNVERSMYSFVRFFWDRTAGTGNLSGSITVKA